MSARRGFTLLEALVVCLVAAAVLGSILAFLFHSQAWSTRASEQALAVLELRTGLARLTREVREARQVVYPAAGHHAQPGLGLVSARGEPVLYALEAGTAGPGAPSDLVRRVVGGPREVVLRGITRLAVTVADPGRGREPSLVRLLVTRVTGPDPQGDTGVSLVASAAARAVQTRCVALRGEEP